MSQDSKAFVVQIEDLESVAGGNTEQGAAKEEVLRHGFKGMASVASCTTMCIPIWVDSTDQYGK
jgi:hypothetical protein